MRPAGSLRSTRPVTGAPSFQEAPRTSRRALILAKKKQCRQVKEMCGESSSVQWTLTAGSQPTFSSKTITPLWGLILTCASWLWLPGATTCLTVASAIPGAPENVLSSLDTGQGWTTRRCGGGRLTDIMESMHLLILEQRALPVAEVLTSTGADCSRGPIWVRVPTPEEVLIWAAGMSCWGLN